jgi:hypothetical protein
LNSSLNSQNLDKFYELLDNYELNIKSFEVAESIAIYKKQKEIDLLNIELAKGKEQLDEICSDKEKYEGEVQNFRKELEAKEQLAEDVEKEVSKRIRWHLVLSSLRMWQMRKAKKRIHRYFWRKEKTAWSCFYMQMGKILERWIITI